MLGLWSLLLPEHCVRCSARGSRLCRSCAGVLPEAPEAPSGMLAVLKYRDPLVRKVLWEFKYAGRTNIATSLAPLLYEHIIDFLHAEHGIVGTVPVTVTEIPMSAKRLHARGRNHGTVLAKELAAYATARGESWRHQPLLTKTRETMPQAKVPSKDLRTANIADSFTMKTTPPGGWVVLVDDIVTSGATLREAQRAIGTPYIILIAAAH